MDATGLCVAYTEADDRSKHRRRKERFDHGMPIVSRAAQGAGREGRLAVD
jgi:hypothetical protein